MYLGGTTGHSWLSKRLQNALISLGNGSFPFHHVEVAFLIEDVFFMLVDILPIVYLEVRIFALSDCFSPFLELFAFVDDAALLLKLFKLELFLLLENLCFFCLGLVVVFESPIFVGLLLADVLVLSFGVSAVFRRRSKSFTHFYLIY